MWIPNFAVVLVLIINLSCSNNSSNKSSHDAATSDMSTERDDGIIVGNGRTDGPGEQSETMYLVKCASSMSDLGLLCRIEDKELKSKVTGDFKINWKIVDTSGTQITEDDLIFEVQSENSYWSVKLLSKTGEKISIESIDIVLTISDSSLKDDPPAKDPDQSAQTTDSDSKASSDDHSQNTSATPPATDDPAQSVNKSESCTSLNGVWVLVPGDPDYGTSDFCMMKYEAKKDADNKADSVPEGEPWTWISQTSAKQECEKLGENYHLINNAEWMTVAANIFNIGSNWSNGSVGSGFLSRGHSDNNPSVPCPANSDDTLSLVDGSCAGISAEGGNFAQKRTHTLSNQEVIWDFSGNVWTWVDYENVNDKPGKTNDTIEYPDLSGTATTPLHFLIPTNQIKPQWNDSWNSDKAIGMFQSGNDGEGGGLFRGGRWNYWKNSGIFGAKLFNSVNYTSDGVGFRCTMTLKN